MIILNKYRHFENFNNQHYLKVKIAREFLGKNALALHKEQIEYHPLIHKKIINIKTEKIYNVEKIYKQWANGWYVVLLIENNKSHGTWYYRNISSNNKCILKAILRDIKTYKLLEEENYGN